MQHQTQHLAMQRAQGGDHAGQQYPHDIAAHPAGLGAKADYDRGDCGNGEIEPPLLLEQACRQVAASGGIQL